MRLKEFLLSRRQVHQLFQQGAELPSVVQVPVVSGLPGGAKVHHIAPSYGNMALSVFVEHPSFDDVPDGHEYPRGDASFQLNQYAVLDGRYLAQANYEELKRLRDAVDTELAKYSTPDLPPLGEQWEKEVQPAFSTEHLPHVMKFAEPKKLKGGEMVVADEPINLQHPVDWRKQLAEAQAACTDCMVTMDGIQGDGASLDCSKKRQFNFSIGGVECTELRVPLVDGRMRLAWCRAPFTLIAIDGCVNPLFHLDYGQYDTDVRAVVGRAFMEHWDLQPLDPNRLTMVEVESI